MNIKKNLPLIVALAIPLVLTLVVGLSIYLPGMGKSPQYDFVYVQSDYSTTGSGVSYGVSDGKIVEYNYNKPMPGREQSTVPDMYRPTQYLFLYDVQTNSSKNLAIADAEKLKIDPSNVSPDGYRVEYGSKGGMFPFFDNYDTYQYIVGNNRRIETSISGYENNLLGWVVNQ